MDKGWRTKLHLRPRDSQHPEYQDSLNRDQDTFIFRDNCKLSMINAETRYNTNSNENLKLCANLTIFRNKELN
jgi:hypothetical protein